MMHIYMYVYTNACIYVSMYLCITCMYIHMYVYIRMDVDTYIYVGIYILRPN
jgi:hypothetical protein